MEEIIELNPLGDTRKEQWKNAIMLWNLGIESNITSVCDELEDADQIERLNKAVNILGDYRAEMNRLVDGIFKEED